MKEIVASTLHFGAFLDVKLVYELYPHALSLFVSILIHLFIFS